MKRQTGARHRKMVPGTVIKFGTDGWRSLVAEDFTLPNVRAVTQAVAQYLKAHPDKRRPKRVIVGYDTRPSGDRFAQAVAEVLAGNGFEVLLTRKPTPTPAVSFAIRQLRLQGGVVITASHNPFTYNGFKFKPSYAGPAEPEMTRWVERRLFQREIQALPLQEGLAKGKIRLLDLDPLYLAFLRRYVEWSILKESRYKVAYDSMRGAGRDLLQRVVAESHLSILPVSSDSQSIPSSHRPEPVGRHLKKLSACVRRHRCDVGLATDGDADRAGIVDGGGRFVSSQETMSLLAWHLLEDRGWRGLVVTTVAGTNLLEAIAKHYRVPFTRTPVGFKHIARFMRTRGVLFGGEESGGFGFRGCVPERDGLLAGLLVLEMMAMRKQKLTRILEEMREKFGRWTYARTDLALSRPVDPKRLKAWAKKISPHPNPLPLGERGKGEGVTSFAGFKVRRVDTLDGAKIILEDKSWLLMRPSGTEPLLRIYGEAKSTAQLKALLRAGQRIGRQIVN